MFRQRVRVNASNLSNNAFWDYQNGAGDKWYSGGQSQEHTDGTNTYITKFKVLHLSKYLTRTPET